MTGDKMRFKSVVFDLDGTISESGEGIARSAEYAFERMGLPSPGEDILKKFVGPPLLDSFMEFGNMNRADAEKAVAFYRERHAVTGWKETKIYKGIFELLYSLKKCGVYTAIASSKSISVCKRTLEYFGLLSFFDFIAAPEDGALTSDKRTHILDALKGNIDGACMVGDRKFDIIGAKQAGVYAIGVGYGYGSSEELTAAGADEVCKNVENLRNALLGDTPKARGRFISFEGSDGCGKSTQHRLLKEHLEKCGIEVISTREPGGCPISERIREVLLDVKSLGMTDECEALLFAAARAQHVNDTILPALNEGKIVLCDRFVDSSIAYQGAGRNLGDWVRQINERAVKNCLPDMTLVFDISPEEAIKRRLNATAADRIELSKDDFRRRVYESFISMCASDKRFKRIDASGSIEQIACTVRQTVLNELTK